MPAVTSFLPFCPLTAFVWSGRTCQPPSLCDTHPCQTEAGLFHSLVHRSTLSCHDINAVSLFPSRHAPNGSPLNLASFGRSVIPAGCTSQKGLGRSRKIGFSPLPTTKPYPLYLLPLAHGPTMSHIGWVQASGAWALRVLSFQICPKVYLLLMRLP